MSNVDSLDRAILSFLRESARAPYVEIAKGVGVTERTVRTRIKRLEDEGVIRGYTVRESGIGLTALIRLKVGPGTEIGSLAGSSPDGWESNACTRLAGMRTWLQWFTLMTRWLSEICWTGCGWRPRVTSAQPRPNSS